VFSGSFLSLFLLAAARRNCSEVMRNVVQKNVCLQGGFSHNWPIWERVIQLLSSGQLDIDPIIGGRWKLEQWQQAFTAMHSGQIVKAP